MSEIKQRELWPEELWSSNLQYQCSHAKARATCVWLKKTFERIRHANASARHVEIILEETAKFMKLSVDLIPIGIQYFIVDNFTEWKEREDVWNEVEPHITSYQESLLVIHQAIESNTLQGADEAQPKQTKHQHAVKLHPKRQTNQKNSKVQSRNQQTFKLYPRPPPP
eukprot:350752_1